MKTPEELAQNIHDKLWVTDIRDPTILSYLKKAIATRDAEWAIGGKALYEAAYRKGAMSRLEGPTESDCIFQASKSLDCYGDETCSKIASGMRWVRDNLRITPLRTEDFLPTAKDILDKWDQLRGSHANVIDDRRLLDGWLRDYVAKRLGEGEK